MASIAEACADDEIIHLSDHLVGGADSVHSSQSADLMYL